MNQETQTSLNNMNLENLESQLPEELLKLVRIYNIGIAGKARSGKDTLCGLLIQENENLHTFMFRRGLADSLKNIYFERTGVDLLNISNSPEHVALKEEHRKNLQLLADELKQEHGNNFFVNKLNEDVTSYTLNVVLRSRLFWEKIFLDSYKLYVEDPNDPNIIRQENLFSSYKKDIQDMFNKLYGDKDYLSDKEVDYIFEKLKSYEIVPASLNIIAIVPDIRYDFEAKQMDYVISIERPGIDNGLSEDAKGHSSENGIDQSKYTDYLVVNKGDLTDLKISSWSILESISEAIGV